MSETITIPKQEYNQLKNKANLFDHYIETEELSSEELRQIKKGLKGPFMNKSQFLKKHPELT